MTNLMTNGSYKQELVTIKQWRIKKEKRYIDYHIITKCSAL